LPTSDTWRGRTGTAVAMLLLCKARLTVSIVPFARWRAELGFATGTDGTISDAKRLAAVLERAAHRLPFETKCLPRSMALSWMLRQAGIGHSVIFGVRPTGCRDNADALHAWVEVQGVRILGDLPGKWIETLRLGEAAAPWANNRDKVIANLYTVKH